MSKNKISEYSSTANSNTDIAGINIDEGCAPSGINNAIRTLMAQLKDWQSGTSGDTTSVAAGGTGVGTLTGIVKGNGTSAFSAATAGTDYVTPTGTETLTNKTLTAPVLTTPNITTGLTLAGSAGTSGQLLSSNGSGSAPTWKTVEGMTLISASTPSNGSTASFTTSIPSYKSIIVIIDSTMEISANGGLRIALSSTNGSSYGPDLTFTNTGTITPNAYLQYFRTDNASSNKVGFRITPTSSVNVSETVITGVINAIRIGITTAATFTGSGTIYIYGCN